MDCLENFKVNHYRLMAALEDTQHSVVVSRDFSNFHEIDEPQKPCRKGEKTHLRCLTLLKDFS